MGFEDLPGKPQGELVSGQAGRLPKPVQGLENDRPGLDGRGTASMMTTFRQSARAMS